MRSALRKMGNSTGVIVPRPLLAALGASTGTELELSVENGRLIAAPVRAEARRGWAEAAAAMNLADEAPAWPDVANDGDDALSW